MTGISEPGARSPSGQEGPVHGVGVEIERSVEPGGGFTWSVAPQAVPVPRLVTLKV